MRDTKKFNGVALLYIGGLQPPPWEYENNGMLAMLDEICIVNKEHPLLKSSNMATMT